MERIFTKELKKQLRQRIKGSFSLHVTDDTLLVDIFDNGHKPWRYTYYNLSVHLSIGLSSRVLADVIVKEYRKYIINHYFH